jgi:predicted Zn finger-like uncharacterized protein
MTEYSDKKNITCPNCNATLKISHNQKKVKIRCPMCNSVFSNNFSKKTSNYIKLILATIFRYFKKIKISKIMLFIIIILLLVIIWMNRWKYQAVGAGYLKVDRITGKVYLFTTKGWMSMQELEKEKAKEKIP